MTTKIETRQSSPIIILAFITIIMVALRIIPAFWDDPNFIQVVILFSLFILLFLAELLFGKYLQRTEHIYLSIQAILVTALSLQRPFEDVSSALFITLAIQSSQVLKGKVAYIWWGIFVLMIVVTLVLGSGWIEGIPMALYFLVSGFYALSYELVYQDARKNQEESGKLLADLERAHQELKEKASQAEELAAARERNRLARELHDSVSQEIFSITLNAQSARLLLERDPLKVPDLLDRLQELTTGALEQLRSLISKLHPPSKS